MQDRTLEYLVKNQSHTPSAWHLEARWRRDNRDWLRLSQRVAVLLISYMKREHLTQVAMAERLGCSQQYVSRILKGTENLTIETLSKIEQATDMRLLAIGHE